MNTPPADRVAAREERPTSKQKTWAPGYFIQASIRLASKVDLPAPVGPSTIVWPTSPTLMFRRNGADSLETQ